MSEVLPAAFRPGVLSALACLGIALAGCSPRTEPVASAPPASIAPQAPVAVVPPTAPEPSAPSSGHKTVVGLLIPLSGGESRLGQDMLDAAELALTDTASDDFVLVPKDTRGNAAGAADAARAAIADGAKLLIGPLTAAEVEAAKPIAQSAGINMLAFSNQTQVAGGNVYLLGFLPQQEARRIADYAHSTGIDHFGVLAPSSAYGQLAAASFQDAVTKAGGTVDQTQYYDPGATDKSAAIKALSNGGQPSFTALFVPEPSSDRLKTLASLLPVYDIDPKQVRLLGSGTWDGPDMGSELALVGGWYAAPSAESRQPFERRFKDAYAHAPQRLATLAYDSVALGATLQRVPGASFNAAALTNPSGFAGADGVFRLLPDGTAERGLAVRQIERHGTTVISPAPESFSSLGQ